MMWWNDSQNSTETAPGEHTILNVFNVKMIDHQRI